MAPEKLKRWAGDIRLWILLFFILRFFTITNPLLEATSLYFAHSKEWVNFNDINDLKVKGLKFIVILKRVFGKDIKLSYNQVVNTKNFQDL